MIKCSKGAVSQNGEIWGWGRDLPALFNGSPESCPVIDRKKNLEKGKGKFWKETFSLESETRF